MRVTVWNENIHERRHPDVQRVYPDGIHETIAAALREHLGDDATVRTATMDEPEHGLAEAVLSETDVLVWWGHVAHDDVPDELAERVRQRVLDGMGFVVLHSAHRSKPFVALMGTRCNLRWREADDREIVWTIDPTHSIVEGIPPAFVIPRQEMYGEYFDIPPPDELVFVSWFSGGEVFRSGCCFRRGKGRIFYFSPGHETYPVYHQAEVRRVIANGVRWACVPRPSPVDTSDCIHSPEGWFER
jgi:trehalose utilization protein